MMKPAFAAALGLLVGACASTGTPAPAAPGALISRYDEAALRSVVDSLGYKVTDVMVDPNNEPSMTVEIEGGLAFQIEGQFCEGEGARQICPGLEIAAILGDSGSLEADALIAEINRTWRPGKLFAIPQGLAFERYLILDGGISHENLAANIGTFAEMLKQLWAKVHPPSAS